MIHRAFSSQYYVCIGKATKKRCRGLPCITSPSYSYEACCSMYQIQQQLLQNICLGRPEFKTHLDFISSQHKLTFDLKLLLIVQVYNLYCAQSGCKGKYLSIFSLIIPFHIAFLSILSIILIYSFIVNELC